MASDSTLGEYLRSSRSRVTPAEAGLSSAPTARRVTGLRREEVAELAGVSVDYYARLEQGRERSPSPQMLDAISRALRLDVDARAHLFRIAGVGPTIDGDRESVHPSLLALVDRFEDSAAYVLGRAFDVLATNAPAAALLAPFAPESNMTRILFTHPLARVIYPEWERMASATVHALRLNAGLFPRDSSIRELVAELTAASPKFTELWNDQTAGGLTRAFKVFDHPEAGRVELTYQTFEVKDAPGQQLLVGTPEPGSMSEQALSSLALRPGQRG